MNTLILKKKIIFINIKKDCNDIIVKTETIYSFIKKKLIILIFLSNCLLKKYSIVIENLKYFYTLKWKCASFFILNSKLNYVIEFCANIKNSSSIESLNYLSNSKYFVSVIRSPFVYKKSMEQFLYEKYKVYYQTNISIYNFFFQNYQYLFLKRVLNKKMISKLFFKITFFYN